MDEHSKNHKKKKIIEKYNSSSHFYDKRYRALQEEKFEIILDNYKSSCKIILDLGCGTGLLFEYIINSIVDTGVLIYKYVALDISWNMLLEFKSKLYSSDYIKSSPDLILADIEYLPFRDNVFHSIFSITAFQNLPKIEEGINESFRVGKKNADFRFSILKKNLEFTALYEIIKPKIKDLKIKEKEYVEDIVILGQFLKDEVFEV